MKFSRRGTTGLFLPSQASPLEYGYYDNFNYSTVLQMDQQLGPNSQRLYWIGDGGVATGSPSALQTNGTQVLFVSMVNAAWPRYVTSDGVSFLDTILLTDQYSQIVYKGISAPSTGGVTPSPPYLMALGLSVRTRTGVVGFSGSSGPDSGYFMWVNPSSLAWHAGYFANNHTGGTSQIALTSGTLSAVSANDVFKLTAVGWSPSVTVTCYQNGSSFGSFTQTIAGHSDMDDGYYRFGSPGIYWGGGSDGNTTHGYVICDDWQGGSLTGVPLVIRNDWRGTGYWFPTAPKPA